MVPPDTSAHTHIRALTTAPSINPWAIVNLNSKCVCAFNKKLTGRNGQRKENDCMSIDMSEHTPDLFLSFRYT